MAQNPVKPNSNMTKEAHPTRPGWDYFLVQPSEPVIADLQKAPVFDTTSCTPACTKTITLLPKTKIAGHTGIGYQMINIDGYRIINAYVISDPLNSTTQRGFSLELSFSLNPFVTGVGVVGETGFFFDCDSYFEPGVLKHHLMQCSTSDLATTGGLPWIGGIDLAHILRVPVLGPYVRASVFNEDGTARNAAVMAYLST